MRSKKAPDMKKYLVIGNPIAHSQSPRLHNYWIKKNNISAVYEKKKLDARELKNLILLVKRRSISGINVTVPFKKDIIPFLDELSLEADKTQSVNTICLKNNKVTGYNTDIDGFKLSIKETKFNVKNKKILILGAGGVVPSIIFALNKMEASQIVVSNRTKNKAENLKKLFKDLTVVDWGNIPIFDMIINATSVGLNKNDKIDLDLSKIEKRKFFYDVIYNPKETNFLKIGKKLGGKIKNGEMMFIYQAMAAFKIWHGIKPKINSDLIKVLNR